MKKTTLILALLFCSLFTKTHAQFYKPNAETLELLNSADYIFEGMVLDSKSYYNADKTKNFISERVNITKVYKGDLKEGTVEFVEEIEIGIDEFNFFLPQFRASAIFLCKKSAFKSTSKEVFDNTIKLDFLNDYTSCLLYSESEQPKFELWGLNQINFKTKQDFENFLLNVKGVKIPTIATARRSQEKRLSFEEFMEEQNQRVAIAKKNAEKNAKKKSKANRTAAVTNELKITLANAIITQTGPTDFFEFDVMASANNSDTYFSNAIVRLDFNTTAFGSNIAATPGALLLTNGSSFPVSEYISNQYDVNSSRINIALGDKSSKATTWNRTRLSTTPVILLHAKIKVVDCGAILGITSFAENTFTPFFSTYTTTAGANWTITLPYTNTYYTNTLANTIGSTAKMSTGKLATSTSMCSSDFSFSPAKIHSGNNQVLTITGLGFGAVQGNVLFQNANLGYSEDNNNYLKGLDNNYIKT